MHSVVAKAIPPLPDPATLLQDPGKQGQKRPSEVRPVGSHPVSRNRLSRGSSPIHTSLTTRRDADVTVSEQTSGPGVQGTGAPRPAPWDRNLGRTAPHAGDEGRRRAGLMCNGMGTRDPRSGQVCAGRRAHAETVRRGLRNRGDARARHPCDLSLPLGPEGAEVGPVLPVELLGRSPCAGNPRAADNALRDIVARRTARLVIPVRTYWVKGYSRMARCFAWRNATKTCCPDAPGGTASDRRPAQRAAAVGRGVHGARAAEPMSGDGGDPGTGPPPSPEVRRASP